MKEKNDVQHKSWDEHKKIWQWETNSERESSEVDTMVVMGSILRGSEWQIASFQGRWWATTNKGDVQAPINIENQKMRMTRDVKEEAKKQPKKNK